jgi:hypothetical protein
MHHEIQKSTFTSQATSKCLKSPIPYAIFEIDHHIKA